MQPLISVIVPIYNTEQYLDKCIESILNQSYHNLEVILVDDGSNDGSPQKCDVYSQKDSRVRVIHQENRGQSSARNVGLDCCSGEYISFVDSDDWIEPDMYKTLMEQIEKYDVALVISGRYDAYGILNEKLVEKRLGKNGIVGSREVLPLMAIGKLSDFSACDKLYRRDLWDKIRFPEGEIYEDFAVVYKVLIDAKNALLFDRSFYVYRHRKNSTITSEFSELLFCYPKQTKQFLMDMKAWYPEYTRYAVWAHIKAIQVVLLKLLKADKKTYIAHTDMHNYYLKELDEYRYIWERDPLFARIDRCLCKLLLCKKIARLVFLLKRKIDFLKS